MLEKRFSGNKEAAAAAVNSIRILLLLCTAKRNGTGVERTMMISFQ
jgi:hypothetical protein